MTAFDRIKAYGIDSVVIGIYIAALTVLSVTLGAGEQGVPSDPRMKLRLHLLAFLTLTLPVILYFAICEAFAGGQTLGKRLSGIRVLSANGQKAGIGQTLLRNVIKFLPWEIAHIAIWHATGRPFIDPMTDTGLAICLISLAAVCLLLASLWLPEGRAIHDRLAGTRVSNRNN